ncbi:FAD-linked oxidase C-terminal domain-containing protein [Castellaniella ginsengisoli]|uniref:D-lactate dehydrogenase (cytochrome) n=1 Tax=Castellaniella ginsengisoli TaxID=546114 RepID=A0AB39ESC2_9BURK
MKNGFENTRRRSLPPQGVAEFKQAFGARFVTSDAVRAHHGRDESPYPACLPDAVVFPRDADEVAHAVRLCDRYRVPIIPFGAGSSLEGHVLPIEGGITLSMAEMNRIISLQPEDFTATVQPGVTRTQVNDALRDTGLFFPIDPGADASIGGMAATRASGTNAVRYGTMRENVVSLKVVTAKGEIVRTGSRARKSSAGYDLTRLFVGSEGTLGIIVEVTLRIHPRPEAVTAAVCNFPTLADAVQSVVEIMQSGIGIARIEFMDERAVGAVNRHSRLELAETPLLLFEFHGSASGVREQAEVVREITRDHGGSGFAWAENPEDRARLWAARHQSHFAGLQLRPGARSVATDVCVPISKLVDCVTQTVEDLKSAEFPFTIVGHVGDGNFHVQMLIDPDCEAQWRAAEAINHRLVHRAIGMEGTCSGEHGVGIHKMEFLKTEHGAAGLELMRLLKHAYDPHNIFNPGKVLAWDA